MSGRVIPSMNLGPIRTFFSVFALTTSSFLALDLLLSTTGIWAKLDPAIQPNAARLRVPNAVYHHGLKPLTRSLDPWGPLRYELVTNSLGYRDREERIVQKKTRHSARIVFMGDSFTEGMGFPWEKTFVGIFQKSFPQYEILNAGVSSYSPSIYNVKIRQLVNDGYVIDHVIFLIDISDIEDEALAYVTDKQGNIVDSEFQIDYGAALTDKAWSQKKSKGSLIPDTQESAKREKRLKDYFHGTSLLLGYMRRFSRYIRGKKEVPMDVLNLQRAAWTYRSDIDYGPLGVDGGIEKAKSRMRSITKFLAKRNVKFSIVVYPWAAQIEHDVKDSRQVKIWRDFCRETRCAHFVDLFPLFFEYKLLHSRTWLNDLFIEGDIHYNEFGNRLFGESLANAFRNTPRDGIRGNTRMRTRGAHRRI